MRSLVVNDMPISTPLGALSFSTNSTTFVAPAGPSTTVTSLTVNAGVGSSSVIRQRAWLTTMIPLVAENRFRKKVSRLSSSRSPITTISNGMFVTPGSKTSTPFVATKSAPPIAVKLLVAKPTETGTGDGADSRMGMRSLLVVPEPSAMARLVAVMNGPVTVLTTMAVLLPGNGSSSARLTIATLVNMPIASVRVVNVILALSPADKSSRPQTTMFPRLLHAPLNVA